MTTDRIDRVISNQKKVFLMNLAVTALMAIGLVASTSAFF